MQITKHQENKFPYSSVAKRALLQVKLPLGAVAFPATDGSRLAAGDKYFFINVLAVDKYLFYQSTCRGQVLRKLFCGDKDEDS